MFDSVAILFMSVAYSLAVNDSTNCYIEGKSKYYNGNIRQTIDGVKCLDWAACPEWGAYTDADFPDGSVVAASNYCRDPDSRGIPMCLHGSCDQATRCDVDLCGTDCYVKGHSKEYRGQVQHTKYGNKCRDWNDFRRDEIINDDNFPEKSVYKAFNRCRDPAGTYRPWCYTFLHHNPYDICNIPVCSTGM